MDNSHAPRQAACAAQDEAGAPDCSKNGQSGRKKGQKMRAKGQKRLASHRWLPTATLVTYVVCKLALFGLDIHRLPSEGRTDDVKGVHYR